MEIIIIINLQFEKNKSQKVSWAAQGQVAVEKQSCDSIPDTLTHIHMLLQYYFTTASKRRTALRGVVEEERKWLAFFAASSF